VSIIVPTVRLFSLAGSFLAAAGAGLVAVGLALALAGAFGLDALNTEASGLAIGGAIGIGALPFGAGAMALAVVALVLLPALSGSPAPATDKLGRWQLTGGAFAGWAVATILWFLEFV
jgi:hypothetical protein